jgi:membrane-associated phospholipid phosphatase
MNPVDRECSKVRETAVTWPSDPAAPMGAEQLRAIDVERMGIVAKIAREFSATWTACGTFEWIALGYLGLSSVLIALFAQNLTHPVKLIAAQAGVAALILILCRVAAGAPERTHWLYESLSYRFWHFWRLWYPHLFFLFCFEEMGKLAHLVDPRWEDAKLIAFDRWLTGVNPSLWMERFAHPALNEFMQFSYFTYFVYLLILGGILYYRRDWESYWAVMMYSAVGYVIGYVIALLFPVQSPWFTLAGQWHGQLTGGPFTALVNFIEKCGRVHGAAFPSQHVAGTMAALWGTWRHRRWLFWVFLPFVVCMCVSTVYVRNHYVADVLGGIVTGTLGYFVGCWILKMADLRQACRDVTRAV